MAQETSMKEFQMPERQRLLCRWTMELAAHLQQEHDMERVHTGTDPIVS